MRIDKPTLMCDRCQIATEDTRAMATYRRLTYYHMSGSDEWDLCPDCWDGFRLFVSPG